MNDIWYVGDGIWVVYVDNMELAVDFASIPSMKCITTYYDAKGNKKAMQFKFFQGDDLRPGGCLLHYVCQYLGVDYSKVLDKVKNTPGVPYREIYGNYSYQPELFKLYDFYEPDRKKIKTKNKL